MFGIGTKMIQNLIGNGVQKLRDCKSIDELYGMRQVIEKSLEMEEAFRGSDAWNEIQSAFCFRRRELEELEERRKEQETAKEMREEEKKEKPPLEETHKAVLSVDACEGGTLRERSGSINRDDMVTAFLYILMRDQIVPGKIAEICKELESGSEYAFTNGWLAEYADYISKKLQKK